MSRVTSVELDKEDVEYIEGLMNEGRVRSLKEFVERCVKFGRRYTLDRWQPGIFNVGPVRMIFIPKRGLDILVERVPEDDYESVGREVGEITRSVALFQSHIDTGKEWQPAFQIMSDIGFGQFSMNGTDFIQVLAPALPSEMMRAYIETVLGTKLEAIRMKIDVQLFRVIPAH